MGYEVGALLAAKVPSSEVSPRIYVEVLGETDRVVRSRNALHEALWLEDLLAVHDWLHDLLGQAVVADLRFEARRPKLSVASVSERARA